MTSEVPYLSYEYIRKEAVGFLRRMHPSLTVPIPVEEIAELELNLGILPLPNLWNDFGLSGFLSSDRTRIIVDEYQMMHYEQKYRFTIAHELGHFALHKEYYERLSFTHADEYIEWVNSVNDKLLRRLEAQADIFAGVLLVPPQPLLDACKRLLREPAAEIAPLGDASELFSDYFSEDIAKEFNVSPDVVRIQIGKERIPGKLAPVLCRLAR